jgi:putative NADH-flavin reductase
VKLAIFGGTGRVGSQVVRLARERGHTVTHLAREAGDDDAGVTRVVGNVLAAADVGQVVRGADAIISTLGVPDFRNPGTLLEDGMRVITRVARTLGVRRVIAVANMGVLDSPGGGLRHDQASFAGEFRPISLAHAGTWRALEESRLDWTLVCTGDQVPGSQPGQLVVLADRYPDGASMIGIEDIADFLLDQVKDSRFLARRVGIAWRLAPPKASGAASQAAPQ